MTPHPAYLVPLAYAAGLFAGLARFGSPALRLSAPCAALVVAAALGLALVTWRRRPGVALGAAVFACGLGAAGVARLAERQRCGAAWADGPVVVTVRLLEPVRGEGALVGVAPVRAGCTGAVLARWGLGGREPSGTTLRVQARWRPRPATFGRAGGLLAVERAEPVAGAPASGEERLRNHLAAASERLFGSRAPLVDALVVGQRGGIARDLQQAFADSGLVHLLSISGFHIGVIVAWVVLLLRLFEPALPLTAVCWLRRGGALLIAAAVGTLYVAFLGWQAPATRAAALSWILAVARLRQRAPRPDATLAASCLAVLLLDPWAILDLGGWLSAACLWGASTATRWSDRAVGTGNVWRMLFGSVGATAAAAPLTALAMGSVATVGVVLNFAAIPVAAVAVPGVLAALAMEPLWRGAAEALAAGSGALLGGLEALARVGATVPLGHVRGLEGVAAAAPWVVALVVLAWATAGRATRQVALHRVAWAGVAALWGTLALGTWRAYREAHAPPHLALHFLDVGQGDAIALRSPAGRWMLIDAGPAFGDADAGQRVVVPFLERHGVARLAALVLSHAHDDHVGGAAAVLRQVPADLIVEPGRLAEGPAYERLLEQAARAGIRWVAGREGQAFELDGVRCTVLHPDPAWPGWGDDLNEDSIVLLVEYGQFRAVLTGDAGLPVEARLAERIGDVDLLKVGHHGSRGATGEGWLEVLRPELAVISVGRGNRYGHPAPEVLARLAERRVPVRRTDQDGSVHVESRGSGFIISSE